MSVIADPILDVHPSIVPQLKPPAVAMAPATCMYVAVFMHKGCSDGPQPFCAARVKAMMVLFHSQHLPLELAHGAMCEHRGSLRF